MSLEIPDLTVLINFPRILKAIIKYPKHLNIGAINQDIFGEIIKLMHKKAGYP